jgi:hypothetical protein
VVVEKNCDETIDQDVHIINGQPESADTKYNGSSQLLKANVNKILLEPPKSQQPLPTVSQTTNYGSKFIGTV